MSIEQIWNDFYVESYREDLDKCWETTSRISPVQNVLELGVCNGGSLKYWSEKVPVGGLVIGVDYSSAIFDAITGKIRKGAWEIEEMRRMAYNGIDLGTCVAKLVSDREVYVVCGDSSVPSIRYVVDSLVKGRQFDFFFHDGAHQGSGPLLDFNNFIPLLRMGGVFCLADVSLLGPSQMEFVPFHKITFETLGTNQVYYRLPPEKWDTGCRQQTIAWVKDREMEMM